MNGLPGLPQVCLPARCSTSLVQQGEKPGGLYTADRRSLCCAARYSVLKSRLLLWRAGRLAPQFQAAARVNWTVPAPHCRHRGEAALASCLPDSGLQTHRRFNPSQSMLKNPPAPAEIWLATSASPPEAVHPSHFILEPTKDSFTRFLLLKFRTVHWRTPETLWRKFWPLQNKGMVVQDQSHSDNWTFEKGKYLAELFDVLGYFVCLLASLSIVKQHFWKIMHFWKFCHLSCFI